MSSALSSSLIKVICCSSPAAKKDVMSLAAHGFHAICFNSETAQIPKNIVESLRLRFRHIILLYDTDETGKRETERQAEQLAGYHVLYLTLPLQGSKGEKTSPTTSN